MPAQPTHHILCIHGIGQHPEKWVEKSDAKSEEKQSFKELMKEKWDLYPQLKENKGEFGDVVELHSIRYDGEIESIFKVWEKHAKGLKDAIGSSPVLKKEASWFTDAVDDASEAAAKDDALYTHLMDLLMFVGSPTLQDRLVNYTGNEVLKIVNKKLGDKKPSDPPLSFSVIGHSMGCAMAHKVISALMTEGVVVDGQRRKLAGNFRFSNVTMVANTSYSLSRDRDTHYEGQVRPSTKAGEGCCTSWINVNHRLDPVARFMPFDYDENPKWLDPATNAAGRHRDITLTKLSSRQIHDLTHYFRDPSFHLPYLELVFNVKLTQKQHADAFAEFEKLTPEGQFKTVVSHFQQLDTSNTESFVAFFEALKKFYALFKKDEEEGEQ